MAPAPTVSVVVPTWNEESRLALVLGGLPPVDEVIVVGGPGSAGGGPAPAAVAAARRARPDAILVRQTRTGRGNALVCGLLAATGDLVVTLDADGSADPGEILSLVGALLDGAEVAHGSRFLPGGRDHAGTALGRAGNHLVAAVVNVLFRTRLTDLGRGCNAYRRDVLPLLDLPAPDLTPPARAFGDGPEIDPLIILRAAARGLRVAEVATTAYPPIEGGPHSRVRHSARAAVHEYVRSRRLGPGPGPMTPGRHSATGGRHSAGSPPHPRRAATPPPETFPARRATPETFPARPAVPGVLPARRAVRDGLASRPDQAGADTTRHRGESAAVTRREAGGSRQRHDPAGRGAARPPELRIITGEGRPAGTRAGGGGRHQAGTPRPRGHLRAVPGERPAG